MSAGQSVDINNILGSEHTTAVEIANLWRDWDSGRLNWKTRVKETKANVYATSTRETTNVNLPWSHSTNLPKITQIFDNLKANYNSGMFPNEDWFSFTGEDRESVTVTKRRAVESYLKTKHRLSNFQTEANKMIDDWILCGNAFGMVTYVSENVVDPETGIQISSYIGPRTYRISPNDIVFNPIAVDFAHSPKIIRSIKSLGEIKRDIEENPELQYEQEIFSRAMQDRVRLREYNYEDVDKSVQMQFDGFGSYGQYLKSGYVEMLDFYGDLYDPATDEFYKNYVITVIDRRYVIRKQPLNTWTGRPHIYHVSWRQRPDNLWGMGPLDNLVGLQYRINHLENARADAFDQMIAPDFVYRGDVQEYPGANGSMIYEVNEAGDVRHLVPDTTVLNADFQIQMYMDLMELFAGAPRDAMGIRTPGEKTAFEVSELMTAAGRIFQNKMTHFELNMLEPLLNAEIEVARRNLNTSDVIKVVDTDTGVQEFLSITREDITANGKLVPVGARHYSRQAQLAQELAQFTQIGLQDQMVAMHFPSVRIAEMWEELLGFNKFGIFEPYARISEQLEAQRLTQIAQETAMNEQMMAADTMAAEEETI
jgi:hypothetical protein